MEHIAKTPQPPYYAVIFTSMKGSEDKGYAEMAEHIAALGAEQQGFLGAESVREANGVGITVSYWASLEAIAVWKNNEQHRKAQKLGADVWYDSFATRVCKVERHGLFKP